MESFGHWAKVDISKQPQCPQWLYTAACTSLNSCVPMCVVFWGFLPTKLPLAWAQEVSGLTLTHHRTATSLGGYHQKPRFTYHTVLLPVRNRPDAQDSPWGISACSLATSTHLPLTSSPLFFLFLAHFLARFRGICYSFTLGACVPAEVVPFPRILLVAALGPIAPGKAASAEL